MIRLKFNSGSVFGGMLLVAGCCIGAGMLALPIFTGLVGFFPSLILLVLAWGFMTFTGLLLIEVNGWFHKQVNLISMAGESLGRKGRLTAWFSYLLLFYSILVAYIASSGSIFAAIIKSIFHIAVSAPMASVFFTIFFGLIIYLGTRAVDFFNRVLMVGLIVSYLGIIALGIFRIEPALLYHVRMSKILLPLPVLLISFGFQNMIPSLTAYMQEDLKKVRFAILGGGLLAFLIYLIWSILVLGIVPFSSIQEAHSKGEAATIPLQSILGSAWMSDFAQGFSFFAIVTSFLAQGLTLTHFIADGLKIQPRKKNLLWLICLSLAPPLLFAFYNPGIFLKALQVAGGIFTMVLFGVLPVSMAWVGRYVKRHSSSYHVKGGKPALVLTLAFSLFVIFFELVRTLKELL